MEKIRHITEEFKTWIVQTLQNGSNPEAIVNAMIKKGFDPIFSYSTLLKITSRQTVQTAENAAYQYEPTIISDKGNLIQTVDRDIKVLLRVEKPFILFLDHVLSETECDQLIETARCRLQPSTIIDPNTGETRTVAGRTSSGTYFSINENALISKIEKRISDLTGDPVEHGEGLQVLHYRPGEEYKPHFDYFPSNKVDPDKGGQRIGTLLLYLNDVSSGGETIFPKIGLSVAPKKGTALYFHYANSLGQVDRLSLHSSIPVIDGEKWVATNWIRQGNIYHNKTLQI
jgi:prolyl 4-hydroxylase